MSPAAVAAWPLWAEWLVAALVLPGRRVGAAGHHRPGLRLPTFEQAARTGHHLDAGPCWCICGGSVLYFRWKAAELALHAPLIAAFIHHHRAGEQ